MSDALELPADIHDAITAHCAEGDRLADDGALDAALECYRQAWLLVPEPQTEWGAATWILAAIGDACFLAGYLTSAREALDHAMACPGAIGNPFLHMRRGQVLFEQGELDAAADELIRAYMSEGAEIFASEDPKYLAFLGARAKLS